MIRDAEENEIQVGMVVSFKSDVEQTGTVTRIHKNDYGQTILTVEDPDGFSGDYIGGQTKTTVEASRCFVD